MGYKTKKSWKEDIDKNFGELDERLQERGNSVQETNIKYK